MAAKKKDWSELLGGTKAATTSTSTTDADSDKPAEPPTTVLMHTIVGNPDNPRPEDDYSDDDPDFRELKASMKEIGQLQPLAVISQESFEKAKPEAVAAAAPKVRKLFREAEWVVITGNRRLAAARQLGWTRIDIRVQDRLGDEDGRIDEAVIIENIHRKNLAPLKEAEYLQRMLERHGTQERVAERIGKSQMFVSQRLALLNLAPDLQEQVNTGTLKIKEARQIARASNHEEQRAQLAELQAKATAPTPRQTATVQNPVLNGVPRSIEAEGNKAPVPPNNVPSASLLQNPVLNSPPGNVAVDAEETAVAPSVGPSVLDVQNPVLNPTPEPTPDTGRSYPATPGHEVIPEPRTGVVDQDHSADKPRKLPYDDAHYCVMHMHLKMETTVFARGGLVWMQVLRDEHPEEYKALLSMLDLREEPSA